MRIVHIVPGTGNFHCGSCLRDQAMARHLGRLGHEVLMVPLYLPLVLEPEQAAPPVAHASGGRIFYGGINVYLQQKLRLFRWTPRWLDRLLDAPALLRWAANHANMTGARDLADLTLSMLAGEEGRQAKELAKLLDWLRCGPKPDVISLSNALLCGMARRLGSALDAPVVCTLQGEDAFLDTLPRPAGAEAWRRLSRCAAHVDAFIAISAYYAEVMSHRLGLPAARVTVVHNGIDLTGFEPAPRPPDPPVLGYLARLCHGKGLTTLVDAFVHLKRSGRVPALRLHVAGAMTGADDAYLRAQRRKLRDAGLLEHVRITPNLDRAAKLQMLRGLSVFSVPATYGEAFGLYVLEALASGVPVVQPRHGAFEEVLDLTRGGVLCRPDDPAALADAIGALLCDEPRRQALGEQGRRGVLERFGAEHMAANVAEVYERVAR